MYGEPGARCLATWAAASDSATCRFAARHMARRLRRSPRRLGESQLMTSDTMKKLKPNLLYYTVACNEIMLH